MPESVKFRHYLFGSNGVWRISTRMIGRMALLQYAGIIRAAVTFRM